MDDALAEIVTTAIDAAVDPELTPELCARIAARFDATAFMIFEYDFDTLGGQRFWADPDTARRGRDLIEATLDGVPPEEAEGYRLFATRPAGRIVPEFELYGVAHDRDMPPNPFRDKVLAAGGSRSRSTARLNDIGPWADIAALHLPVYGAEIPAGTRAEADLVVRILGKSFEARRTVEALTRSYAALLDAFDALDFGVAICGADGRIRSANSHFEAVAAERDGLELSGGAVQAVHAGDRPGLHRALRAAVAPGAAPADLICGLRRRSGAPPLIVRTAPLRSAETGRDRLVLLLVIDPADEARLGPEGLAAFDLLTPAELEVCALLLRGLGTTEIAERRSTAAETTRDQIKSASAKLGCSSRLDLVRLALAARPPASGA